PAGGARAPEDEFPAWAGHQRRPQLGRRQRLGGRTPGPKGEPRPRAAWARKGGGAAAGVRVNFVGNQDRLGGSAGQAAEVWLRAAYQIWSSGRLACSQRSVAMALAPATVQCMPDSLRRCPMTALQP